MRIAFYAPLKSPDHPVPSGDRLMARLLIEALRLAGHTVDLASEFRSFQADPDEAGYARLKHESEAEIARIADGWKRGGMPALWFCYHPYYKAPDLIGPRLTARFGLFYVTAEASWSPRRFVGSWAAAQDYVLAALRQASLNICLTKRDRDGLEQMASTYRLAMLPPFIDTAPFSTQASGSEPARLITVAMMRPGDKLDSYRMLGRSLSMCLDLPWTLTVVGDGPAAGEVRQALAGLGDRVVFMGERPPGEISGLLSSADLFVWPGINEAFGMAFLEAQAAGLPVVAQDQAGVSEVVRDGVSGLLTGAGDPRGFAEAVRVLLAEPERRRSLAASARCFVHTERSLDRAALTLRALLSRFER